MNITVIGAGNVGQALGLKWAERGHRVTFGVRDARSPEALRLLQAHEGISVEALGAAVEEGDVILLAIPSKVILETVEAMPSLKGKILLDCSNPMGPANHASGRPDISIAERLAGAAPGARVVKIFNTVGFEVLADPDFNGTAATMFFCCDEETERDVAKQLASDAGFDPVLIGGLANSPMLEQLTLFWGMLAYGQHLGRHLALKLLMK
jgi:predicted dinucleotide-binding enzyme